MANIRTFKVGDKVRVIQKGNGHHGQVGTVEYDDGTDWFPYKVKFMDGKDDIYEPEHLEHAEKTLATLQEGDVVTNDFGQKTILGVIRPGLYVLSSLGQVGGESQERVGDIYTAIDLEKYGWSIKQDAPAIVEKTVADLEQELKLSPGSLRIKKDAA